LAGLPSLTTKRPIALRDEVFEAQIMTRTLSTLLVISLAVAMALATAAQEPGPPPPPGHGMEMHGTGGPGEPGEGKTVTGVPLTAQIVVTHENALADGNHISRTTQITLYRDGQGRVRREMTVNAATPATASLKHSFIMINDPVAGKRYMLDPQNKTAREMPSPPHGRGENGRHPAGDEMRKTFSNEVQKDQLGNKTIDGYQATGERVTRTIAAGEIGNEKPIEVVTERWFSTDLQLPVLIVHTDPMMGTATTKVTSVTRGEPDASLFQVPPDYKVVTGRPDEPFYVPLHP
jgi:hypothetical protein